MGRVAKLVRKQQHISEILCAKQKSPVFEAMHFLFEFYTYQLLKVAFEINKSDDI